MSRVLPALIAYPISWFVILGGFADTPHQRVVHVRAGFKDLPPVA